MSDSSLDIKTPPPEVKAAALKRAAMQRKLHRRAAGGGRPSNLDVGWDDEEAEWTPGSPLFNVITAIRKGAYVKTAAAIAGMAEQTVNNYKSQAFEVYIDDDGEVVPFDEMTTLRDRQLWKFYNQIQMVEGLVEYEVATSWAEEAKLDWKAGQAFLAVRFPERWSPKYRERVEIEGPARVQAAQRAQEIRDDPKALAAAQDFLIQIANQAIPDDEPIEVDVIEAN